MRIRIHRGAKEIGGTCIEIESQDQRIVLDVGLPLDVDDPDQFVLHPIKGFDRPDPSLLGVVISHPHQDHYGLAYRLPKETPFLIGKAAQSILAAADVFSPAGLLLENVLHLEDRRPITLGPFSITPYLVDHSAYDSYAVLVEADGKRLFYTGDFRAHGRKARLFERLVVDPPKGVDVLLMEGTNIGRADADEGLPGDAGARPPAESSRNLAGETDVENRLVELFRKTPGMPLVWCSGQNIDRLVSIFRACKRANRQFIIDMYTAHVLRATGNESIPQAEWEGIKVFLPTSQKRRIIRRSEFDLANSYQPYRIFPEQLSDAAPRSVMLFRPSMMRDVDAAKCLEGSRLICSIWAGYLEDEKNKPLLDWLQQRGIPLDPSHTSGHAAVKDLLRLRQAFPEAVVVPVHTEEGNRFNGLFGLVDLQADGQWYSVCKKEKSK